LLNGKKYGRKMQVGAYKGEAKKMQERGSGAQREGGEKDNQLGGGGSG